MIETEPTTHNLEDQEEAVIDTGSSVTNQNTGEGLAMPRNTVNYFMIAAVFLAIGVLLGINIGGSSDAVDAVQLRSIVQEIVTDTYAEQMETLQEALVGLSIEGGGIDSEALSALVQAAVEDAVAQQVDYMEDNDPYMGPDDAPVVMVEFSDFLCGFCGRHFQNTLQPILQNYEGYIKYVYRDFPGVGGQNAFVSAMAAECANDQGAFWDYHTLLFNNQSAIGVQDMSELQNVLISYAGDLSLDTDTFTTCLEDQDHYVDVIRDLQDAQSIGAQGTPAFYINGTFVSGAQPYEMFASIIEAELEEAGIDFDAETAAASGSTEGT